MYELILCYIEYGSSNTSNLEADKKIKGQAGYEHNMQNKDWIQKAKLSTSLHKHKSLSLT